MRILMMSLELCEKWEIEGIYGLWRTSIVMFNFALFSIQLSKRGIS
jgi:hypothetical protein